MRARPHITAALCAAVLSVGVVSLPAPALGDAPSQDEGDTAESGDSGDDGTTGTTGTTEEGSDDESFEFDDGFQGSGPAELAGEEGGGCGLVAESVAGFGFLGLLGLGATRRRESASRG